MILQAVYPKENIFKKEFIDEKNENVLTVQLSWKEFAFLCHLFTHDINFTRLFREHNPNCLIKVNLTELSSPLDHKS